MDAWSFHSFTAELLRRRAARIEAALEEVMCSGTHWPTAVVYDVWGRLVRIEVEPIDNGPKESSNGTHE